MPTKRSQARKQRILTLSSPEHIDRKVPDNFLDKCWFCHKKLKRHEDIFMHSDFSAFCTPECRLMVIDMGNMKEKAARLSAQRKAEKVQSSR